LKTIAKWSGIVVGVAFAIAALVMLAGKATRAAKAMRRPQAAPTVSAALEAAPEVSMPENGHSHPAASPARNGFHPKLTPTRAAYPETNGHFAKGLNGKDRPKRKEFDYNRYFADLMSTVSSHGLALEGPNGNGQSLEIPRLPLTPAEVNGNGHASATSPAPYGFNAEMIASQTTLIEEQRRLIQEQGKLIEEKSRLIAEKNEVLHLQRELIEHKML
jgi:hypothetical protein